jgi:hypothetical protein
LRDQAILWFELRVSCLLGRHSTTCVTPAVFFYSGFFGRLGPPSSYFMSPAVTG